jgi:hypothetical protein
MTDDEARAATAALFDIAASLPPDPARERWSGLVVQQALLHGRRPPA